MSGEGVWSGIEGMGGVGTTMLRKTEEMCRDSEREAELRHVEERSGLVGGGCKPSVKRPDPAARLPATHTQP